jgi:hypothetical protein
MLKTAKGQLYNCLLLLCCNIFLFGFFFSGNKAFANNARLFLSSSSTSYKVGDSITITLNVDTAGGAIDSAEGKVTYPTSNFDHVATSVSGSQFVFWTHYPEEDAGTVTYGGGKPNPGYSGSSGNLLTIILKAKTAGTYTIGNTGRALSNGQIVTGSVTGLQFTIAENPNTGGGSTTTPTTGSTTPSQTTTSFKITSSTHPDSTKFYPNNDPKFSWTLPQGTQGLNLINDKLPGTVPLSKNLGSFSTYELKDLAEGTWYLHVKLLTPTGWGPTTHFKYNISAPDQKPDSSGSSTEPTPSATLPPIIELYQVELLDSNKTNDSSQKTITSSVELQAGGRYVKVVATDESGNTIERTLNADAEGIQVPTLEVPVISEDKTGPVIKGTTSYPNSEVIVSVENETETTKRYLINTDAKGSFEFSKTKDMTKGTYSVWAEVITDSGIKSFASEKKVFEVKASGVIVKEGTERREFLTGAFVIVFFVLTLMLVMHQRISRKVLNRIYKFSAGGWKHETGGPM